MADIKLWSASRYNGGVAVKRKYGSSTVTEFHVLIDDVLQPETVKGYGKTPGERKTYAKMKVLAKINLAIIEEIELTSLRKSKSLKETSIH